MDSTSSIREEDISLPLPPPQHVSGTEQTQEQEQEWVDVVRDSARSPASASSSGAGLGYASSVGSARSSSSDFSAVSIGSCSSFSPLTDSDFDDFSERLGGSSGSGSADATPLSAAASHSLDASPYTSRIVNDPHQENHHLKAVLNSVLDKLKEKDARLQQANAQIAQFEEEKAKALSIQAQAHELAAEKRIAELSLSAYTYAGESENLKQTLLELERSVEEKDALLVEKDAELAKKDQAQAELERGLESRMQAYGLANETRKKSVWEVYDGMEEKARVLALQRQELEVENGRLKESLGEVEGKLREKGEQLAEKDVQLAKKDKAQAKLEKALEAQARALALEAEGYEAENGRLKEGLDDAMGRLREKDDQLEHTNFELMMAREDAENMELALQEATMTAADRQGEFNRQIEEVELMKELCREEERAQSGPEGMEKFATLFDIEGKIGGLECNVGDRIDKHTELIVLHTERIGERLDSIEEQLDTLGIAERNARVEDRLDALKDAVAGIDDKVLSSEVDDFLERSQAENRFGALMGQIQKIKEQTGKTDKAVARSTELALERLDAFAVHNQHVEARFEMLEKSLAKLQHSIDDWAEEESDDSGDDGDSDSVDETEDPSEFCDRKGTSCSHEHLVPFDLWHCQRRFPVKNVQYYLLADPQLDNHPPQVWQAVLEVKAESIGYLMHTEFEPFAPGTQYNEPGWLVELDGDSPERLEKDHDMMRVLYLLDVNGGDAPKWVARLKVTWSTAKGSGGFTLADLKRQNIAGAVGFDGLGSMMYRFNGEDPEQLLNVTGVQPKGFWPVAKAKADINASSKRSRPKTVEKSWAKLVLQVFLCVLAVYCVDLGIVRSIPYVVWLLRSLGVC